jgi:hypothetical protein
MEYLTKGNIIILTIVGLLVLFYVLNYYIKSTISTELTPINNMLNKLQYNDKILGKELKIQNKKYLENKNHNLRQNIDKLKNKSNISNEKYSIKTDEAIGENSNNENKKNNLINEDEILDDNLTDNDSYIEP